MVIIKYWLYSLCCTICPCSLYILPFLNLPTLDIIAFFLESGWVQNSHTQSSPYHPLLTTLLPPHSSSMIMQYILFEFEINGYMTMISLWTSQIQYYSCFLFGGIFILFCFPRVNISPLLLFTYRIFFLHNLHFFFISNLYIAITIFF